MIFFIILFFNYSESNMNKKTFGPLNDFSHFVRLRWKVGKRLFCHQKQLCAARMAYTHQLDLAKCPSTNNFNFVEVFRLHLEVSDLLYDLFICVPTTQRE